MNRFVLAWYPTKETSEAYAFLGDTKSHPLQVLQRMKVLLSQLELQGPMLRGNFVDVFEKNIYRIEAGGHSHPLRVYYRFGLKPQKPDQPQKIWVLHAFVKKAQKVPDREKKKIHAHSRGVDRLKEG